MTELPLDPEATELDPVDVRGGVEAILLVADEPIVPLQLAATLGVATGAVEAALAAIQADLADRGSGIELRQVAGGFRLYTAPQYAAWVERYVRDGQVAKLTQAALETLAVVAYKQPISRARISAIRGVNVDSVVKTLESRGLIEAKSEDGESGSVLFGTTNLFLEKLGLNSVDELPEISQYLPDIATSVELAESI